MLPAQLALPVVLLAAALAPAQERDWPTYRGDGARSAYTPAQIAPQPRLRWTWRARHAPRPAWPRAPRITYDRVFNTAVAGGLVFFGSSTDAHVYALDAATGRERWRFGTEGPVRFTPAVSDGRVFAVSDDGWLYALRAETGELLWKKRGGIGDARVLGNGRLVSRWPARGGPVVRDSVVYFAAGIWPTEGIYLHALEAATGRTLWLNDETGSMSMAQPHGGAVAESGVSAQGHLVATDELLLVPTGRSVPAAFRRSDGAFEYYHLQKNGHRGGTATMASGKYFFNSGLFFDAKTGTSRGNTGAVAIAGLPDGIVTAARAGLSVYRWQVETAEDGRQVRKLNKEFTVAGGMTDRTVVVAGGHAVAGGEAGIAIFDLKARKRVWSAQVEGTVHDLAVAGGRLFVSTDAGEIHCYEGGYTGEPVTVVQEVSEDAFGDTSVQAEAAERILAESGVRTGFCVDLECGEGELAFELARRSELVVFALDPDPERVARVRDKLRAAGLYGNRVTVHVASSDVRNMPRYVADLVVSGRSVSEGADAVLPAAVERVQRPHGGVACIGRPDALRTTRRGALAGEGTWTHQYADPGNTVCSGDTVRGPLGVLWFRDIGQSLTQRHGRGPSPLYVGGRLFSLGLDELIAVNAYNGRLLWRYPLPGILAHYQGDHLMGIAGTHSPYCATEEGIFVRTGGVCLRIDPATGVKLGEFAAPPQRDGRPATWGYLACDGGILYGSVADREHVVTFRYVKGGDMTAQLTESESLFAMDVGSGEMLWQYQARHSIRHNAIAIGGGRVYLIDRRQAEFDRTKKTDPKDREHRDGVLIALDAHSGVPVWRQPKEVFGTVLGLSVPEGALMMSYQPTRFRLDSEIGGRIAALDTSSGVRLWDKKVSYSSRPMINGSTIYAQGGAWDLRSGDDRAFDFSRSYGCGVLACGENLIVYRSATLGMYDLSGARKNENFGGVRPGCWINALPAGGLLLVPDGSSGCACSYQNKSWIALAQVDLRPPVAARRAGTYLEPFDLELSAEDQGAVIRYTLDGAVPTEAAARYAGPLRIDGATVVRARAFKAGAEPSRVTTARYDVDPNLVPLEEKHWRVWDAKGAATAPSKWKLADGGVEQTSNILEESKANQDKFPDEPHYGTLRIYRGGKRWRDGTLSLRIESDDNDGIGIAFRCRDEAHHYLLHMDRQRGFSVLARRNGNDYRVLARSELSYEPHRTYELRVELDGPRMTVFVDGEERLSATDRRYRTGTIALHSWGSTGVRFRDLRFHASK